MMKLFHSGRVDLPKEWVLSELGYVKPESYIEIRTVKRVFRRPERMNYFLNTSSKARKRLDAERLPSLKDQTILNALPDLYNSLFKKHGFNELSPNEQTEMLRQIRFRFNADITQAARVCGITYSEAARILDTY